MSMRVMKVALPALLMAAACQMGTGPEGTGPALLSITPTGGAMNVSRTGPIAVAFDGAMGTGMEQYMDLHRGDMSSPMHPMTCTWSTDRTTAICVPNGPMDAQTQYAMHLGGGLRGVNGMPAVMTRGSMMGGESLNGGMMHSGQSMSMMGKHWKGPDGSYGMMFRFRTGQ